MVLVLSPVELLVLILVVVLLEVALFWAAAALGDAPPLSWGKLFLVSFLASAACAVVGGAIAWSLQSIALPVVTVKFIGDSKGPIAIDLLAPENPLLAAVIGLLALLVSWVIPGVLYAPLIPVSISRGMLISVVQVLMRIFLYVMIVAVGMVILAVWQIIRGADARTEILVPALTHVLGGCESTPPPSPLPEAERGSKTEGSRFLTSTSGFQLPLSASGRGLGGGVASHVLGFATP